MCIRDSCYTKTSDAARLDAFLKTETSRSGDLPFDLETAIRVCRQAGFYEHATYLARRYRQDEAYLMIMLEDVKNYQAALDYLSLLEPQTVSRLQICNRDGYSWFGTTGGAQSAPIRPNSTAKQTFRNHGCSDRSVLWEFPQQAEISHCAFGTEKASGAGK